MQVVVLHNKAWKEGASGPEFKARKVAEFAYADLPGIILGGGLRCGAVRRLGGYGAVGWCLWSAEERQLQPEFQHGV